MSHALKAIAKGDAHVLMEIVDEDGDSVAYMASEIFKHDELVPFVRVLVAAPDLLEACEIALSTMFALRHWMDSTQLEAIGVARDAIKKAKGEE